MTIRAFSLLLFRLRFAVINKCKDQIPVLQLGWRAFQLAGAAGLLLVDQLPGVTGPADEVEEHGQVGEGRRQQGLGVEELDGQVEPGVPRQRGGSARTVQGIFTSSHSLPLCVHVVVDFLVCDGQHHYEYPQQDHADHELVENPHRHHGGVDGVGPGPPDEDTAGHVVSGHPAETKCKHAADPEM